MTGPDRALTVSGSLALDVGKLAELVLAGLADRGVGIRPAASSDAPEDGRGTEQFAPEEMPPRGTVGFGEHTSWRPEHDVES